MQPNYELRVLSSQGHPIPVEIATFYIKSLCIRFDAFSSFSFQFGVCRRYETLLIYNNMGTSLNIPLSEFQSNRECSEQIYRKLLRHGTTCGTNLPILTAFIKLKSTYFLQLSLMLFIRLCYQMMFKGSTVSLFVPCSSKCG